MNAELRCTGCNQLVDTSHNLKSCPACGTALPDLKTTRKEPWYAWEPYALVIGFIGGFVLTCLMSLPAYVIFYNPVLGLPDICGIPLLACWLLLGYSIYRFLTKTRDDEPRKGPEE